jgi:O2-independent ubiquinone biosynthesis protein UbiV
MTAASEKPACRLALGPVQYYWPRDRLLEFYEAAAGWNVDTVYLGEVVCAKRRALRLEEWLEIGERLAASGKEVALSTLTLLEAASELGALRRWCNNGRFPVEANDMAAVNVLSGLGVAFIGGPALNVYNARTLGVLARLGLCRWVPPVELSGGSLGELMPQAPECDCEVFAWGRMPLAWSARCYTARAENRPKDRCNLACLADPDGRLVRTREDEPFLVINGIQTQSALTQNLAPFIRQLLEMGVSGLRLSPQSASMEEVVRCFRELLDGRAREEPLRTLEALAPIGTCDGYWRGQAGFTGPRESAVQ